MRFKIEPEGLVNGRDDFIGLDRAFNGIRADIVALADDATAFDSAAREVTGPALRPMVAATRGIDLRGAAKFGEVTDKSVIEHAPLVQVFDERAVAFIVHGRDDVLHACDRGEGLRAVNVPGDFVED